MRLDVSAALKERGKAFPFVHRETLPPQDILGETVAFADPVVLSGTFSVAEERLQLKGTIAATVHAHCARCLAPVEHTYQIPFHETFVRSGRQVREASEEEEELALFEGSTVELDHLALSLTLLELPIRFLCQEDCKGVAQAEPNQLANASRETLDHAHPFAALRELLTKDQEV